jgi:TPR repeat protein
MRGKSPLHAIAKLLLIGVFLASGKPAYAAPMNESHACAGVANATMVAECATLAENGSAIAQYRLGLLYYAGKGVPQDFKTAMAWFLKSAEQGNADAQASVAAMYENGTTVNRNIDTAIHWYRRAALLGHVEAQFTLGTLYGGKNGVVPDDGMAMIWLRKAADMRFNLAATSDNQEAVKNRAVAESMMKLSQIEQAQGLARAWLTKRSKADAT